MKGLSGFHENICIAVYLTESVSAIYVIYGITAGDVDICIAV